MRGLQTNDIAGLVSELSVEGKASPCSGSDFWHTQAVERVGVPAVMMTDGPHGCESRPGSSEVVKVPLMGMSDALTLDDLHGLVERYGALVRGAGAGTTGVPSS